MDLLEPVNHVLDFMLRHPRWIGAAALLLAFGGEILPILWGSLAGSATILGGSDPQLLFVLVPAATIGSAIGDAAIFLFARRHRDHLYRMWPIRDHPQIIGKVQLLFDRWGPFTFVAGRFSWPLRTAVPLVAAITNLSWPRFLFANCLSALVFSALMMWPTAYGWRWLVEHF